MSTARKLRAELAAYLEPYGLSVELLGPKAGGMSSAPGSRTQGVAVFDGDRALGRYVLENAYSVVGAVKALHKLRPEVPLLKGEPPRASRSRKPVEQPALSLPPARAPQVEDGEQHDEGAAAFVQALAEDMPTTQAPPAQAREAAARLFGCAVIARVRLLGELEQGLPSALFDAAAEGLAQHRPTWLVRDPDGRLAVLVTNHAAAA